MQWHTELTTDNITAVYYLWDQASAATKIGFSSEVQQRLIDLQVGNPNPLVLLAIQTGTQETERQLHQQFAADHIRGEWYRDAALWGHLAGNRIDLPVADIILIPREPKRVFTLGLDRANSKPTKTDRWNRCIDCGLAFEPGDYLIHYRDREDGAVSCKQCHNAAIKKTADIYTGKDK